MHCIHISFLCLVRPEMYLNVKIVAALNAARKIMMLYFINSNCIIVLLYFHFHA